MQGESQTVHLVARCIKRAGRTCPQLPGVHEVSETEIATPDSSTLPELPWRKVATDLFEWKQEVFLLLVDYYSRYIEIARLNRLTATEVNVQTTSIFARHRIPETVIFDNGPQFSSQAYTEFAQEHNFNI